MGAAAAGVVPAAATIAASLIGAKSQSDISKQQATIQKGMSEAEIAEAKRQFNITSNINKQIQNIENEKFKALQAGDLTRYNDLQQNQRQLEKHQTQTSNVMRKAYQAALEKAGVTAGEAESEFMQEASQVTPELKQLAQDIRERGTETLQDVGKEMAARLASQGVRGGQASTLMGRALGETGRGMQRDINTILAEDAMRRQAEKMAYQKALGLGAEQFLLRPESATQYDTGMELPELPEYTPIESPDYDLPEFKMPADPTQERFNQLYTPEGLPIATGTRATLPPSARKPISGIKISPFI